MTTNTSPDQEGRGGGEKEKMEGTAEVELTTQRLTPNSITTPEQPTDLTPLNIIRTETVLSRLPIHNLAKKGRVDIRITKKNEHGEVDLFWEVSYSDRYGQPRQLAYKLDTIVINRRIDETGRPLPKIIWLGSQRELCKDLNLDSGNKADLKKAMLQNASAFITGKLTYRGKDGAEKYIEFADTRYGVVFTGERLPDGRKADAIYLVLHDPYWEVLNNAPIRPLDYDYLKALPPAAQRFYEIVSFRIFAAIKYKHPYAKLTYSDFCTYSAAQRYYDREHVRKQMYFVHRPHLKSGYLANVSYESTTDTEGKPDWLMLYTPGPKAHAEYQTFHKKTDKREVLRPRKSRGEGKTFEPPKQPELTNQARALVAHFHTLFHHTENVTPQPKELDQAQRLITEHGFEKAKYLLNFSHRAATETRFTPQVFGGILSYTPQALAAYEQDKAREHARAAIEACTLCDNGGWITYEDQHRKATVSKCPHDLQVIEAYERRKGLRRVVP